MSTIYSDAAGNKYLGDCRWGNHDINYPTKSFLQANPLSSVSAGITNLATEAGLLFRNVISQAKVNEMVVQSNVNTNYPYYLAFGFPGDIDDRFVFVNNYSGSANIGAVTAFTDAGLTNTSNNGFVNNVTSPTSPSLFWTKSNSIPTVDDAIGSFPAGYVSNITFPNNNEIQFAACASANSLSLSVSQFVLDSTTVRREFFYACKLLDVNTNFNYYNANIKNQLFILCAIVNGAAGNYVDGRHYIASSPKRALQTGRAIYDISCSDGQTPGSQWATDMWVYDNNATLGYPVIGRVPNMLLGIGTYTYLKPVKIQGSVFPDNGSPWYLPVGTFAEKTLLMRCYSSIT